jgi:mannan polymerase II complex ANP1 subunit
MLSQMARRMDLSVIGLPHYTIWHAYEPSVDDIKHMEVSFDLSCLFDSRG